MNDVEEPTAAAAENKPMQNDMLIIYSPTILNEE